MAPSAGIPHDQVPGRGWWARNGRTSCPHARRRRRMTETHANARPAAGDGRIVTFYSYKGGTGRTMALANVAWILAANGYRVLVADWDLESPGLHRFFHPFLDETEVSEASGIIDLIRDYEWAAARSAGDGQVRELIAERARVQRYALSLDWEYFPDGGGLDFLSPGRQNDAYAATLGALDWDNFYEKLKGGEFLDALRADMKRHYDYALIDSRTGLSDIAEICTVHLPDILVDCFTLSTQGIEGAAQVARLIETRHKDRGIRILPVPMRVDPAEKEKVEAGLAVAVQCFAGLPAGLSPTRRREYWAGVEVPYRAFYAYEETLAVFGDPPGSPASLLSSFERVARHITGGAVSSLPALDDQLRNHTKAMFTRQSPVADGELVVEFVPEDQVWGEWIADVIRSAGLTARERRLDESAGEAKEAAGPARVLTVVSGTYIARYGTDDAPELPVYVTAARPAGAHSRPYASIAGASEREAIERLHRLIGVAGKPAAVQQAGRRYPGVEPKINTAPVPNIRFTGRENDLRLLREQLRAASGTARPLNIQGLGGVGKTQIAIEYVRRFKTDYDLVWWLDCGLPQFIDASLADLGTRMQDVLGVGILATANAAEVARQVLDVLSRGQAVPRWLLIYDNAEYIDAVREHLPASGGDVVITSRHRDWADHATSLQVDVFSRQESITHLRKRVPTMAEAEAGQVAELLGDLPLAVATAGAWLAETGVSVFSYMLELQRRAPHALALRQLAEYPQTVAETWGLSLTLLRDRSPAAARPSRGIDNPGTWDRFRMLWPHLGYADAMHSYSEPVRQLFVDRVRYLWLRGDFERGREQAMEVDAAWQQLLDSATEAPLAQSIRRQLLHLRFDLAIILRDQASFEQARALDEKVLAEQRELLGPDHPHTLMTAGGLAADLRALGNYREALNMDQAIYPAWTELYGESHGRALRAANNLAVSYRLTGNISTALQLDEHALQLSRTTMGPLHPHTLRSASNVVRDLIEAGRYAEAVLQIEVVRQQCADAFGADSRDALNAALLHGIAVRSAGQPQLAEPHFVAARDGLTARFGNMNTETLAARLSHSVNQVVIGHNEDAEAEIDEVRSIYEGRLGRTHPHSLVCLLDLACARRTGQPHAAMRCAESAVSGLDDRLGAEHPYTLAARAVLGVLLADAGDLENAEKTESAAATTLAATLTPLHPDTLRTQANLLLTRRQLGAAHAEAELEQIIEKLAAILGEGHPHIATLRGKQRLLHFLDPQPF